MSHTGGAKAPTNACKTCLAPRPLVVDTIYIRLRFEHDDWSKIRLLDRAYIEYFKTQLTNHELPTP